MSLQHGLHRIPGIRKAQKRARQTLYLYLPSAFWMGTAAFTHAFCTAKSTGVKEQVQLGGLSQLYQELTALHILPHCTQTSSGKEKTQQKNQLRITRRKANAYKDPIAIVQRKQVTCIIPHMQ